MKMIEFYYILLDSFRNTYTGLVMANFFDLVIMVGPYFAISLVINVVIRYMFTGKKMNFYSGSEKIAILIAGFIGLVSPFPTYIAVPLGMSFTLFGLPFSAIFAFMVSSPLMNPGIFLLTLSQLGWEIALSRVLSAYLMAITAGLISGLIWKDTCQKAQATPKYLMPSNRPFWVECKRSFLVLGKYFSIAIFISALIKSLVPAELISRMLGGNASMGIILAIAMGVPFYSCGGAAIPLIQVLHEMGMNKGAVLAFFIAGPSTKLETMYVYKSILGLKFLFLYLGFIFLGAFLFGSIMLNI